MEQQVSELNTKKQELEAKLASPDIYANADTFKEAEGAYKQATQQLEAVNQQYEELFEKIMKLEEQLSGS